MDRGGRSVSACLPLSASLRQPTCAINKLNHLPGSCVSFRRHPGEMGQTLSVWVLKPQTQGGGRNRAWRSDEGQITMDPTPTAHNPACVTLGKWLPLCTSSFSSGKWSRPTFQVSGAPTLALGAGGVLPSSICVLVSCSVGPTLLCSPWTTSARLPPAPILRQGFWVHSHSLLQGFS